MTLGQDTDKFLITLEQYKAEGEKIPDRFGAAFITNDRDRNYFNKNWEINNDKNK